MVGGAGVAADAALDGAGDGDGVVPEHAAASSKVTTTAMGRFTGCSLTDDYAETGGNVSTSPDGTKPIGTPFGRTFESPDGWTSS